MLAKSCICHDLAGAATLKNGIDPTATPAVCCGPNIVNFARVATLEEMVGHIYGRKSLLTSGKRPHMFLREVSLNIDYFRNELAKQKIGVSPRSQARSGNSSPTFSAASITIANMRAVLTVQSRTNSSWNLTTCSAMREVCSLLPRPSPPMSRFLNVVRSPKLAVKSRSFLQRKSADTSRWTQMQLAGSNWASSGPCRLRPTVAKIARAADVQELVSMPAFGTDGGTG